MSKVVKAEKKELSAFDKLPPRRRLFVLEYVKDFNGKQAAIRAGYKATSAEITASKLLSIAKVKEAAAESVDQFIDGKKTELKKKVLRTLEQITDTTENDRDRIKAVELLGKFAGLWKDDVNVQANIQVNFDRSDDGF